MFNTENYVDINLAISRIKELVEKVEVLKVQGVPIVILNQRKDYFVFENFWIIRDDEDKKQYVFDSDGNCYDELEEYFQKIDEFKGQIFIFAPE